MGRMNLSSGLLVGSSRRVLTNPYDDVAPCTSRAFVGSKAGLPLAFQDLFAVIMRWLGTA